MNIENHIVTMDGSGLSEAFWDTFVRDYWGKRPVLFKNVFATPFCPPSRLFETFLVAAERRAKTRGALSRSRKRPRLDFYGDGFNMQVLEDHAALLPTREDESFERYQERVERQLGTQQWGVVLNTIHPYSFEVWRSVRDMLYPLFERIGLPAGRVGVEAFIGPYDSTPFGVHKDQAHIFTIPVLGQKITRLWPYASIATHLGLAHGEQDLDKPRQSPFRRSVPDDEPPIRLEASVGDLTYWPASYWHIIDGQGDLNGALTIGFEPTAAPLELLTTLLTKRPAFSGRILPVAGGDLDQVSRLHAELMSMAEECARALQSKDLSESLRDELTRTQSAMMFDGSIEPLENVQLEIGDSVELDVRFPILTNVKTSSFACFANGHHFSLARSEGLGRLVELLNEGGVHSVSELLARTLRWSAEHAEDIVEQDVLSVLQTFVTSHALTLRKAAITP